MATIAFDPDNKLHTDLFDTFKQELVSDTCDKDHLYCQYDDYSDKLEFVALHIAATELGIDEDFDEYCSFAIQKSNADDFMVIVGLEFENHEEDNTTSEFIKLRGEILVKDNKRLVFVVEHGSPDYATNREFEKARRAYRFGNRK